MLRESDSVIRSLFNNESEGQLNLNVFLYL